MRLMVVALVVMGGCLGDNSQGSERDVEVAQDTTAATEVQVEVVEDVATELPQQDTAVEETIADTVQVEETIADTVQVEETVADTVVVDIAPEVSDPCAPNPCSEPPAAACDGNTVVTWAALGTCDATSGHAACTYPSTRAPCGDAAVCDRAECLPRASACDHTFDGRISYVKELHLANQERDAEIDQLTDPCCWDFTGDGHEDNKLGTLIEMLSSFIQPKPNDVLKNEIHSGERVILFQSVGLDDLANDPDLVIYGLDGRDTDDHYTNNANGVGTFTVSPDTFVPGTSTPRTRMPATVVDHTLTTHDAVFWLERLPFVGIPINLLIEQVHLTAITSEGPDGVGLALDGTRIDPATEESWGAELGGVFRVRSLFDGLNGLAHDCGCLTFPGAGDLVAIDSEGTASCADPIANGCNDDTCQGLVDYCSTIIALLTPDVDLDGDGQLTSVDDGLSIGFFLKATSATIVGVDGCQDTDQ